MNTPREILDVLVDAGCVFNVRAQNRIKQGQLEHASHRFVQVTIESATAAVLGRIDEWRQTHGTAYMFLYDGTLTIEWTEPLA